MIVPVVCFQQPTHRVPRPVSFEQIRSLHFLKSFLLFFFFVVLLGPGCAVRNAEYDQLISNGDYVQAKELIRRLLDELSYRDENPSMPARRAQMHYWLANAHGKLAEYDSLKLALSLSVSNDPGFEDARLDLLREYSLLEYNKAVVRYNEAMYDEAIAALTNALDLAESQQSAYAALIHRHLSFAEIKKSNARRAARSLSRSAELGDNVAQEMLNGFENNGTLVAPDLIQKIDNADFQEPPSSVYQPPAEEPSPSDNAMEVVETPWPTNDIAEDFPPDTVQTTQSWTVHVLTSKDISRLPFRGTESYLPIINGVVSVNRGLYVRGSRTGETGYRLNGISVLNPFYNSNGVPLIPEAIEQLEIHTGAYGPELGSMNGGMVISRMKTGGDQLRYTLSLESDDFVSPGNQYFNTSAYGYRNIVGTVGGPIQLPWADLKFFVAGEHHFMRNRQPMFLEPFRYDDLVTDYLGFRPAGEPLPGPVEIKRNYLYNNWLERTILQGNASASVMGIDLTLLGSYSNEVNPQGNQWPDVLRNIFAQKRSPLNKVTTKFGAFKAEYQLTGEAHVWLTFSFQDRFQRTYDPDFKHNWLKYQDSLANAQIGYNDFVSRYQGPRSYSTIFQFTFNHPSTPNNQYSKNSQSSLAFSAGGSVTLTQMLTIEAGGSLESWTMRFFRAQNIGSLLSLMDTNNDGVWDQTFSSEYEQRVFISRFFGFQYYGYDWMGAESDDGPDGAREPTFASAYLNAILKDGGFTFRVGGRHEFIKSGNLVLPDVLEPTIPFDSLFNHIREDKLEEQKAFSRFLPRLSISYDGDDYSIYAAYGQFMSLSPLSTLYITNAVLSGIVNPFSRVPYNVAGPALTFTAGPEHSTQYEIGFWKELLEHFSISALYYHKDMNNQLQLGRLSNIAGTPVVVGFVNTGQGNANGLEVALRYERKNHYALFAYTLSDAEGRTSNPRSNQIEVTDVILQPSPLYLFPYDYSQLHRGTVLAGFSFDREDGPVLDGAGIDIVATFNSGHPYTKEAPTQNLGAAGPWNIGVRTIIDVRSSNPMEPLHASRTPWYLNLDLQVRKAFAVDLVRAEISLVILNVFNRKHVLNLYPNSGAPNDDTWLSNQFADPNKAIPMYEQFYRTINLRNRWAYMGATGHDVYGTPRQLRLGLKVGM